MSEKRKKITSPSKIPASGWKKILIKAWQDIDEKNLSLVSAGVAFYVFLAVFPALIALISIYGLVLDPQQLQQQITSIAGMMPQQALELFKKQIEDFISTSSSTLSWGIALSILFSLWSANKGTKSLFLGVNIAYNINETRGFLKLNAITLLFTLAGIVVAILTMGFIVIFPAIINSLGLSATLENIISYGRWIVLAAILIYILAAIYKFAPNGKKQEWKWAKTGAIFATVVWLIASWGFSYYVSNFGGYGEIYGSIAAVIVFMLWLFITCFTILMGAEINSDSEAYASKKNRDTELSGNF